MSGTVSDRKRLIRVTAGNLRNNHLYITGHLDFFPSDAVGSSKKSRNGQSKPLEIWLDGMNVAIETDLTSDAKNGKPRRIFRGRKWVREFYEHHHIKTGDVLALERLKPRRYRLSTFDTKQHRSHDWHKFVKEPLLGHGHTVIDLFAGCGGLALGFKNVGYRTVLAVEWDADACATLRANITDRVAQCAIEEIDTFPKADVIVGGPPCQGFSNLGEKVPFDPRRQLWRQFLRAVTQVRPAVFMIENVAPLLKSQEYVEIRREAQKLGYTVDSWVLNAADYGVPQVRRRAIVIGCLGNIPTRPPQAHVDPSKRNLLTAHLPSWRTVADAIGDLSFKPTGRDWHIGRNPTPMSLKRYAHIPLGGNRWNLPLSLMPPCWKRKTKGGTDLFGRLWWDRPAVTIRTEFYKPEKGRYLHPEANRPITHREAARLQGFPDDFEFCGNRIKVGIQIGNAVPPPFGLAIAEHLKSILDRESHQKNSYGIGGFRS